MTIKNIKDWGFNFSLTPKQPFLISGPCSAETEEQVIQTCTQIADLGVHLLRAGIWKPRTRPGSFEGLGEKALPWLKKASEMTGLPTCCEVATGQHVETALKYGVNVLWIGARTTVNPFAVQEIADAVKGIDVPIMVKNPVNPDLELWIGAIERISHAGVEKIAAIHRGFSVYNSQKYRNQPQWEIPIELRRRIPNLEVICDPSHISGTRTWLYEIAQQALDLNFDGLMLESHISPDTAWSDALQQVTPEGLQNILTQLTPRQLDTNNSDYLNHINQFREVIDQLDAQTLELLSKRMDIVRKIGIYKKENNIAVLQLDRWANIRNSCLQKAADYNLSLEFVESIINTIHKESIRQQTLIMRDK